MILYFRFFHLKIISPIFLALFNNLYFSIAQSRSPNIIYIMADDLGYADLGCYGRKDYQTPNLDKLASQGIKFTNAYAAAPLCTPTRTAFMTGRYPARTLVGLCEPLRGSSKDSLIGLGAEHRSVATLLKKGGYETALFGKWHLGFLPQFNPNTNGFDEFFGFHPGGADYISHNRNGKPSLYHNETLVNEEGYLTDLFSGRAVKYIKQDHAKPFFLSIQFSAPHWPWQGPLDKPIPDSVRISPAMKGKGGSPAIFAAMMKSLDDAVGNILKAIEEANLSPNTVVIFTSDNGGEIFSDMGPFTGIKGELLEGGIRVPAIIRWPGVIPASTTSGQVAITMDWTVTILAMAGLKADPAFPLDGINLLPVCTGKQPVFERALFWRTFQGKKQKTIRQGEWKYLQDEKGEYLFNLVKDQGEKNNLKIEFENKFAELKRKYEEWERTVLKPISL